MTTYPNWFSYGSVDINLKLSFIILKFNKNNCFLRN